MTSYTASPSPPPSFSFSPGPSTLVTPTSPPQHSSLAGFCSSPGHLQEFQHFPPPSSRPHYPTPTFSLMATSDCGTDRTDHSATTDTSFSGSDNGMARHGSSSTQSSVNGDSHVGALAYAHADHGLGHSAYETMCDNESSDAYFEPHSSEHERGHFAHANDRKRPWTGDDGHEVLEIQQPTPKRTFQQFPATPDLTPNPAPYYPSATTFDGVGAPSASMAVSRTLSYGTPPHQSGLARSLSLGAGSNEALALTAGGGAAPFSFRGGAPYSPSLEHSPHLLHPNHHQQLLGSPMSSTGAFVPSDYATSAGRPCGASLRRSDSAPMHSIGHPSSLDGYFFSSTAYPSRQEGFRSPVPHAGFAPPGTPHNEERYLAYPSTPQSLRQSAPHPNTPYTPSQAALLSAASMNRLLSSSGPTFLPSPDSGGAHPGHLQRRHTIQYQQDIPLPPDDSHLLLHLHHTPASAAHTQHYQPPPSSPSPSRQQRSSAMVTMYEDQHHGRERYRHPPPSRGGEGVERGHPCQESHCGRVFKRLEHLRRHERTHTSEKPFGCDWDGCGRFFSRSDNLTQHKKTHSKIGGRNGPGGRSLKKSLHR